MNLMKRWIHTLTLKLLAESIDIFRYPSSSQIMTSDA